MAHLKGLIEESLINEMFLEVWTGLRKQTNNDYIPRSSNKAKPTVKNHWD